MTHELNSIFILIHPPLAILGYIFTFIAAKKMAQLLAGKKELKNRKMDLKIALTIAFWLTFAGLVTGMIWAKIAWGKFWQWDPKETATLAIFVTLTLVYLMHLKKVDIRVQAAYLLINIVTIIITISITFLGFGLHAFG
jgi:cytochrome c biogenesis factor